MVLIRPGWSRCRYICVHPTSIRSGTIDYDIQDFDSSEDSIDIVHHKEARGPAQFPGTRFKLDTDNNGTYEMEFNLVGYTGTADDVTVIHKYGNIMKKLIHYIPIAIMPIGT